MFAVRAPLLARVAAILLVLAFFGRNSAARAKIAGDQRSASWLLMACAATIRGVVVTEFDEDPRLGRLARRLLPSRRCRTLLRHHR
jgi:hypothetical protein